MTEKLNVAAKGMISSRLISSQQVKIGRIESGRSEAWMTCLALVGEANWKKKIIDGVTAQPL